MHRKDIFCCALFLLSPVYGLLSTGLNENSENFIPCEKGWYYFGEKCYKIGDYDRVTWEVARDRCAVLGGKLASIHSKEQNDFFNVFLAHNTKQFPWIGLNDRDKESIFIWEDRSSVDYVNWDNNQPDNAGGAENCVELILEEVKGRIAKWNDRPCSSKKSYICQKESNKELKTPDPRLCFDDEGGGWKFQDSCFTHVNEKKSWEEAEKYCQDTFNGHLMMILDDEHDAFLEFVLRKFKSTPWIGLKIQDRNQQMWTTGWPVFYNHFDKSLEEMGTGSCILRWNKNVWTNVPCDEKYEFLCEKVDPPAIKKPTRKSKCPEFPNDWKDFGGEFCYFTDDKLSVSWYKAQEICNNRGGMLATIHSKEEEKVLWGLIRPRITVSIGLNSLLTNGEKYAWSDGSPLTYTHWALTEPNDKNEMCVRINYRDMSWIDVSCNVHSYFLCQVKKEEIPNENEDVRDEDLTGTDPCAKNPTVRVEKCKDCCERKKIFIEVTV